MAEWRYFNPNPDKLRTGDCVIRAVCAATGKPWQEVYTGVALAGLALSDMPSSNRIWRFYLKSLGFSRHTIPDTCPDCYTVNDFAEEHPKGTYILGTGTHAVCVKNGITLDTFDSRGECPQYYYTKER